MLWIDWGQHRRTHSLSGRLGANLHEVCIGGSRLSRYAQSVFQTFKIIRNTRPDVVIATIPSVVLGLALLVFRRWFGFKLVFDAHYFGVKAVRFGWLLQRYLNFQNTRADLVIVTNDAQAGFLSGLGAKTYVCQDPLPQLPDFPLSVAIKPELSALLICSFDIDEPYEVVFEAFRELQEQGITLFVTGNEKKAGIDPMRFPWVRFLGFVPDAEYYGYLTACTVIIDLTTFEDCLVCGAYEAIAARKPLVVSKTAALSAYFGSAVVLTDHTASAIRNALQTAFAQREELIEKTGSWIALNEIYMKERVSKLTALLGAMGEKRCVLTQA